ncbi:MAG: hypothetical protein AAGF56_02660 [Pseudomonadota bacterium]
MRLFFVAAAIAAFALAGCQSTLNSETTASASTTGAVGAPLARGNLQNRKQEHLYVPPGNRVEVPLNKETTPTPSITGLSAQEQARAQLQSRKIQHLYVPPGNNVEAPWNFTYRVPKSADGTSHLREEGLRVSGVSFGTGGEFFIAANLQNKSGLTEVCGAWAQTDGQSAYTRSKLRLASKMVSQASVQYKALALVRDLSFMGEVTWDDFEVGAPATCKLTSKPWRAEYAGEAVQIRIPTAGRYQL